MTVVLTPDEGEGEGAVIDCEGGLSVEVPPSWAAARSLPTTGEAVVTVGVATTDLEDDERGAGGGLGGNGGSWVSIEVAWVEMPVMP